MKTEDLKNKLESEILKLVKYSNEQDEKYVLAASMIGNEELQVYLKIKYGSVEDTRMRETTLGSLVHKALEQIGEPDSDDLREYSMKQKIDDEWVFTGTADRIIIDHESKTVHILDYKVTKKYAHKMLLEDLKQNKTTNYSHQLGMLSFLWKNEGKYIDYEIKTYIVMIIKDIDPYAEFKGQGIDEMLRIIEIPSEPSVASYQAFQLMNSIKTYFDTNTEPPKCEDVWTRKPKFVNKPIDTKCELYCAHNKYCPYYKQMNLLDKLGARTYYK